MSSQEALGLVLIYLVIISAVTSIVFKIDYKRSQRTGRFLPNGVLLLLVFLGGTLGALRIMRGFGHKRYATKFRNRFWWIVFLQVFGVLGYLAYHYHPAIIDLIEAQRWRFR